MNEEKKNAPVSSEKRTALLRYLAILFAVAFLLVLLSYLIQAFHSQSTIDKLNITSASALQNAVSLQETNRELTQENKILNDELDDARASILEYQESINAESKAAADEAKLAATEAVQKAYDLLLIASNAASEEEKARALEALKQEKEYLSEQGLKLYAQLLNEN